jgi:protein-L-isoaspartate(D-aspartate) O-methyltransferase
MTSAASRPPSLSRLVHEVVEPFTGIEEAELGPLLDRLGQAKVVLLGEATHGTSEFYRMRARITRELITRRGFTIVAVEADWPDACWIDRYVRHAAQPPSSGEPFKRFPTWMWRNQEVAEFVEWLRWHNGTIADPQAQAGFYGLDLYSLYGSIGAVLDYLDEVDPGAARIARERYACLAPWAGDPAGYGRVAVTQRHRSCENEVVAMLVHLLERRLEYARRDGARFLEAAQNARLIANAERYYRVMYHGSVASWNLRDQHMFDTLRTLLAFRGPEAKAVVWEHNSHIGDAAATEMGARGEHNVGHLCRQEYADGAYLVGFGTDHGTVAAADNWDEPMQVMTVRPAHADSYERICHDSEVPAFLLPLREPARTEVREELIPVRLERAIGVIYRPSTELDSHYFQASLPHQFDEYVWFDRSNAVTPLRTRPTGGLPDTYPFGL